MFRQKWKIAFTDECCLHWITVTLEHATIFFFFWMISVLCVRLKIKPLLDCQIGIRCKNEVSQKYMFWHMKDVFMWHCIFNCSCRHTTVGKQEVICYHPNRRHNYMAPFWIGGIQFHHSSVSHLYHYDVNYVYLVHWGRISWLVLFSFLIPLLRYQFILQVSFAIFKF